MDTATRPPADRPPDSPRRRRRKPDPPVQITVTFRPTPMTPARLAARERFLDSWLPRVLGDDPVD
jgi:hypothetical protein